MGGAVSFGADQDDLIDKLITADYVKTLSVELVLRAVDRAFYFLPESLENAYKDVAWKNGNIHLSAPCIYAEVLESLELGAGMSFLNLGSGTGYLSTMAGLILGPYGINHGVELYGDVIEFAWNRLFDFKKNSPALDCYEFCEPIFVKGNCLSIACGSRLYDRVYCGAACPGFFLEYMKNLLKVNGILVMPLNDKLVQITRTSEILFETKIVLSVSFSLLQLPTSVEKDPVNPVVLPEVNPLPLQELCRSAIRSLLRKHAQQEYPNIKVRKRKVHTRPERRLEIRNMESFLEITSTISRRPYAGSDEDMNDDMGESYDDDEEEESNEDDGEAGAEEDEEAQDENPNEDDESGWSTDDQSVKTPKRKKVFSHGRRTSGSTSFERNASYSSPSTSASSSESSSSGCILHMDVDSDCEQWPSSRKSGCKSRCESKPDPQVTEDCEPDDTVIYTDIMKEKIQTLPLPPSLKIFLNHNRPF